MATNKEEERKRSLQLYICQYDRAEQQVSRGLGLEYCFILSHFP